MILYSIILIMLAICKGFDSVMGSEEPLKPILLDPALVNFENIIHLKIGKISNILDCFWHVVHHVFIP